MKAKLWLEESPYRKTSREHFPENGSWILIGQPRERNVVRFSAAVLGEEHCVTTLKTAVEDYAKTSWAEYIMNLCFSSREYLAGTINWIRLNAVIQRRCFYFSLTCKKWCFTNQNKATINSFINSKQTLIPASLKKNKQTVKTAPSPAPAPPPPKNDNDNNHACVWLRQNLATEKNVRGNR